MWVGLQSVIVAFPDHAHLLLIPIFSALCNDSNHSGGRDCLQCLEGALGPLRLGKLAW